MAKRKDGKKEEKERKQQTKLSGDFRMTKNRLTKIPDRVLDIDTLPKLIEKGTFSVTSENAGMVFKEFLKEHKDTFKVDSDKLNIVSIKKSKTGGM